MMVVEMGMNHYPGDLEAVAGRKGGERVYVIWAGREKKYTYCYTFRKAYDAARNPRIEEEIKNDQQDDHVKETVNHGNGNMNGNGNPNVNNGCVDVLLLRSPAWHLSWDMVVVEMGMNHYPGDLEAVAGRKGGEKGVYDLGGKGKGVQDVQCFELGTG
nr:hypothetical protein [Tanacetum cinerariifolium]